MTDLERIAPLFAHWDETMVWSCLQGVMGRAVWNGSRTAAAIISGDFGFLAGEPDEELLRRVPGPLLVPRTGDWFPLIERVYGVRAVRETRYAILKEPDVFDRAKLARYVASLPTGYVMRQIDRDLVPVLLGAEWSRDFCAAFDSPEDCCRRGLGYVALWNGTPVAGAGSYCVYRGGIEIEIDTREDHRRRGLAAACGARLILECLDRGRYPSWDAHDLRSVALAEKLGYHRGDPYPVYWIGREN